MQGPAAAPPEETPAVEKRRDECDRPGHTGEARDIGEQKQDERTDGEPVARGEGPGAGRTRRLPARSR